MCVALADGGTAWALDASGSLWFRTGVRSSRPQGDDDHWWQVGGVRVRPRNSSTVSLIWTHHLCTRLSPPDQYFGLRGV